MEVSNVTLEMLRTCNRLFSRKTRNDGRAAEPQLSSIETSDQAQSTEPGAGLPVREAAGHGGGWMLSVILAVNILILGCALVSGSAFNRVAITPVHRHIFIIILLLLTMLWMLFYTIFTRNSVSCQDRHAGPLWLRVGLVLFGLLGLIMDMFMIATYVGHLHCDSPVKVALPVVQAVFIFSQTYFLWIHAKDCVQLHKNLTRCGLAVTLSTNLVVWMAAVAEESIHHTDVPGNTSARSLHRGMPQLAQNTGLALHVSAGSGHHKCKCSYTACGVFKEAYYYLYPFNMEYSLFAAAMAYVMWKNVGRLLEEHPHHNTRFQLREVSAGPVAGILLVLAGLATFIVYEVRVAEEEEQRESALLIHFITNIVIVSLMTVCALAGLLLYRLDRRRRSAEENPTRTLDVGLLVAASMGQLLISYFSIVALVATGARGHLGSLNLAGALLTVVQVGTQNHFVVVGLHREPHGEEPEGAGAGAGAGAGSEGAAPSPAKERGGRRFELGPPRRRLGWKRRTLKEICAFLLLANVILWIMPAFGARPQFDQSVEIHFYKFNMWAAIVNIGLQFGVFYRMHSVANLFEVYIIV